MCTLREGYGAMPVVVVHGPPLSKAIGCFPALEACMMPSVTVTASLQVGRFQFRSSSRALIPISEMHGHELVCMILC